MSAVVGSVRWVLVVLPPSQGKAEPPRRGRPWRRGDSSFPELDPTRDRVRAGLVRLARDEPDRAAALLGLGPGLRHLVDLDAHLDTAPTLAARDLYTGVLFTALDLPSLAPKAATRAGRTLVVASGLWGLLRPADRVPAYRLPVGVSLPGTGSLAAAWREPVGSALTAAAGRGPLLDLRSGAYRAVWEPAGELARRTATVRVLREAGGRRTVVSEANKAVKGRLTRALLLDGAAPPASLRRLVETVVRLGVDPPPGVAGWRTEPGQQPPGRPLPLDLVVTDETGRR